jgi:hypothetical protein
LPFKSDSSSLHTSSSFLHRRKRLLNFNFQLFRPCLWSLIESTVRILPYFLGKLLITKYGGWIIVMFSLILFPKHFHSIVSIISINLELPIFLIITPIINICKGFGYVGLFILLFIIIKFAWWLWLCESIAFAWTNRQVSFDVCISLV